MTIDIHLKSGLVLRDAPAMLVEKFRQWPWDKYDGDRPHNPDVVDPGPDVDRVYRLGARTPRSAYLTLIEAHGAQLTACLRSIPADVPLEDADLTSLRQPLVRLFDLALAGKHLKLAGVTKLLFPFRPLLLPVIDSVVDRYYWFATSINDEPTFRRLGVIEGWGDYIFELLRLMQADVDAARSEIDDVLDACKGHPFSKASRVRIVESLLWQYYARAGSIGADADD
jgi:hypothetical protein